MERQIIRAARVDGGLTDILAEDGIIREVRPDLNAEDAQVYDAAGRIVIPGFVDCHLHLDKSHLVERMPYAEGTGGEKGSRTRLEKAAFTVEDITERAERVIRQAIRTGTAVLRTNVDVDAIVGLKGMEALLALRERYRGVLTIQVAAFSQEGIFSDGKTPQLLEEALRMGADLVGGHTITGGEGARHIDFILDLAERYGVPADFHLDESGERKDYLLPYLAQRVKALELEGRVNGIHMCTLAGLSVEERREALDLLLEAGLTATVAPTAISTRCIAPVKELLEAGIPVGLGSDNVRDLFNPLGSGDIKPIALLLAYLQRFYADRDVGRLWNMITAGGAQVLGVEYGIRPGGSADFTILDAQTPGEVLANQAQPVWIMRGGRVLDLT